jgi:hypothetical protein
MTRRRAEAGARARMSGACAPAVVAEHPRPGGGSSAIARARAGRPGTPVPAAPESPASQRRPDRCERAVAEAGTLDVGTTWAELLRSGQQIWAWPVGSPERERLCTAVKQRMPRWRGDMAMPRAMPTSGVHPAAVSRGCAHCGRPCESQAIDGVGYCSTEQLLLARVTGVSLVRQTWRNS